MWTCPTVLVKQHHQHESRSCPGPGPRPMRSVMSMTQKSRFDLRRGFSRGGPAIGRSSPVVLWPSSPIPMETMEFYWDFMGFYWDSMGFYWDSMGSYGM